MFYLVEIECIGSIPKSYKYKRIIYTKNPEIAKRDLYNYYSIIYKFGVIFKTFRKATKEEITKYVMDDGDWPANLSIPEGISYIPFCFIN